MEFVYRGRVAWKFGDFFPGDHIVGREGFRQKDPEKLKDYVLTIYDPEFPQKFRKGDLMIAGRYFGGTRDHGGARALKALGVSCVVAESFSRSMFRGCIRDAFPVLECPGISRFAEEGHELEVNLTGEIRNLTTKERLRTNPAPQIQLDMLEAGGLIPYLRRSKDEGA